MASLVMTIDSSDDEEHNKPTENTQPVGKKEGKKAKKEQAPAKQVRPAEADNDGDLMMAAKEEGDPSNALFLQQSDDDSDGQAFLRRADGGKGTRWNFKGQLVVASAAAKPGADTDDTSDAQPHKPFTMQDRVKKHLRICEVDIAEELQELDEKNKSGEKEAGETKIELKTKMETTAALHYDKDDLVQFHELMLSKPLVKACSELDYDHPTVIQRKMLPAVLEGHDILAHAVTGSGKTAAYLLPMLQKYLKLRQTQHTEMGKLRYLILQPTRELAAQSHSMLESLAKYMPPSFNSCVVFGGSSLKDQKRQISTESPDVIVATTGRLIDHVHNTKGFTLDDVEMLVLDEADRLLEMGFKEELMAIVKQCRNPKRQTLMVSATLNQDLKELAQLALKEPMAFSVEKQQRKADLSSIKLTQYLVRLQFDGHKAPRKDQRRFSVVKRAKKPADQVKKRRKLDPDDPDFDSEAEYGDEAREYVSSSEEEEDDDDLSDGSGEGKQEDEPEVVEAPAKGTGRPGLTDKDFVVKDAPLDEYLIKREATLIALLKRSFRSRVIIFVNEKVQATRVMALMTMYGFKAAEVHGNLTQEDRLKSVEAFQCGEVDYLIGTDLVARGLDISNVKAVINFSFPTEPKRYLHRIGRTARAGQHGIAITLCNEEERKELKKLSRKLNQTLNTFTIQNKFVEPIFDTMATKLGKVVSEIQCELEQEREMQEAMKELQRSENLIKYKKEIEGRPQKQWFIGQAKRDEIAKESKGDLKTIKEKFEGGLSQNRNNKNKRQNKSDRKDKKEGGGDLKGKFQGGNQGARGSSSKPGKGGKPGRNSNSKSPQKPATVNPNKQKIFKKKKHLGGKKK